VSVWQAAQLARLASERELQTQQRRASNTALSPCDQQSLPLMREISAQQDNKRPIAGRFMRAIT
jgi:hypothetical protein